MFNTITFYRVLRAGIVNFWRNIWLSLAATLIMIITLIILSTLLLLFIITNYSVQTIKERVDISAYFKPGISDSQILNVKDEMAANPNVREIAFTSAAQALEDFKQRHQGDEFITESLDELNENPLPGTLNIKAHTLEQYPAIAQELESEKYRELIDKVNFADNRAIIERLNTILKFIITFGLVLVSIFAMIAILVIFNTITLTIYNRREEIEIMRLVGATNWYIRGPFIVEALMYSVVATIVTSALFIPIYTNLLPKINTYLNQNSNIFAQDYFNLQYLILAQLVVAIVLSIFSTLLAVRKYLRI